MSGKRELQKARMCFRVGSLTVMPKMQRKPDGTSTDSCRGFVNGLVKQEKQEKQGEV